MNRLDILWRGSILAGIVSGYLSSWSDGGWSEFFAVLVLVFLCTTVIGLGWKEWYVRKSLAASSVEFTNENRSAHPMSNGIRVVAVDLKGVRTEEGVLLKFGEVLEFGGPNGNHSIRQEDGTLSHGGGWGVNWDAMQDSLRSLDAGGIWGTAKKIPLPVRILVKNYEDFQQADPQHFSILQDVLKSAVGEYKVKGVTFEVVFV